MHLKGFLLVFLRSWAPAPDAPVSALWRRWLVLVLFWPLLAGLLLANTLGLWLDEVLFPGYRRVRVREPVFVIGVPRSGTTFLHRLLALDEERFTTTGLWELVFAPSITQRYAWRGLGLLDRALGRPGGRLLARLERRALGGLDAIHSTGLGAPEEDYLFLAPVLGCFLLVLPFPDERLWRLAYFDRDLTAPERDRIIRFYRRQVQRHLWFHGSHRTFLSKNPSFTPMLNGLAQAFPDGRFLACFRNPTEAVPSQISSMLVGARIFRGRQVDDAYWRDRLSAMLQFYYQHLFTALPALGERRHAEVRLEQLAEAPDQRLLSLYRHFGWTPSPAWRARLAAAAERGRQYRSEHHYSLDELAISAAQLGRDFGFVYRHFDYPLPAPLSEN